jgi:vanillate O-demethylase monooxygenase subunit
VGDEPVSTKLLDVQLAVFRGNDGLSVVLDRCPHRWVKLSAGKVVNGNIECPYHALQFSGSGQCVHMPGALRTSNSEKIPRSYRVASFPVVEKYGLAWTCLDDSGDKDLPEFPGIEGVKLLYNEPREVPCSAQRQIENFFDLGHLPIVHQPSLGGDVDASIKPGKISALEDGVIQMVADYEEIPMGEGARPVTYTHRITLPFVADLTITDDHGDARFLNIATPTSAFDCRAYQILFDTAEASEHHANVIGATNQVNDEDKYILENTPPVSMRLDGRGEIHMAIDNMSLAYRKALLKSGLGQ